MTSARKSFREPPIILADGRLLCSRLPTRFMAKVKLDSTTGCWEWIGSFKPDGYGQYWYEGTSARAHRFAYATFHSVLLAPNVFVDHKCFNRVCVNPHHLRPVSAKQNSEHRQGPATNNPTGVRGVALHKPTGRYKVTVGHRRRLIHGGYYDTIAEAEQVAIRMRSELFTHDDGRAM